MQKKQELETKIMELENKKAVFEDEKCYLLAEILENRIEDLKIQLEA